MSLTLEQIDDFKQCMEDFNAFMMHVQCQYDEYAMEYMHMNRLTLTKTDPITGPLYLLWQACFKRHARSVILAPSHKAAIEIFTSLMGYCDALPDHIRPTKVEPHYKNKVEFENGGIIQAESCSSRSTRGCSFNTVYISDCALIQDDIVQNFFNYVYPTISSGSGSKLIINRGNTVFDNLWETPDNGFVKVKPIGEM